MATFIGMSLLVIGMIVIVVGWNAGAKWKIIGTGVLLILAGSFIGIGGNSVDGASLLTIGVYCVIGIIISIIVKRKRNATANQEKSQKLLEEIGATNLDRFFVECVLSRCDDLTKEKNKQRAHLLAEKYNLKYTDGIEKLYEKGLEKHKAVSQRFILNRIEKRRIKERRDFDNFNKYSDLTGKSKRITMLNDRINELLDEAKCSDKNADLILRSGQQKERDWASWAGAADALGGLGAAVSVAADIQRQNMEIRAQNEQRLREVMPVYLNVTKSATLNRHNADKIKTEIEEFKMKLVNEEIDSTELLKKITFSNTDVLVSETGAAMVCTCATLDPKFRIFGDVRAVVDGTIIAKIYDGDKICGTAQLVLPVYGVGEKVTLNGICIDCCEPGKKYTVKFVAKNLWALEK